MSKHSIFSETAKPKVQKCTYCKTTFNDDILLFHEKECVHQPIKCPGCSAIILLKDVGNHHCRSDKGNGRGREAKKNLKEAKPKVQKCTYCETTLNECILFFHEPECVHQPIKCPGCSAIILLKDVGNHHCTSDKESGRGREAKKNLKEERKPSDLYECPLCKEKLLEKDKSIHESFYCEALFENAQGSVFATLIQDFKKVLLDGQDHNLIFNVRDKEIKAHRDILRARSEVFRSMLNHDMVENTSGVVNVPDCDPEAFEQLLLYIYSGKVEKLDENNMFELYYAADKYSLSPLKQICGTFIKRSLSVTNVCEVIKLAMKHSDEDLRSEAVDYFMNVASDIFPTVEWQTFLKENSTVANELIIKAFNKVKVAQSS